MNPTNSLYARIDAFAEKHRAWLIGASVVWVLLVGAWGIISQPLQEWDESRFGENAYWMIQTGDWVNAYYAGEPDVWNVKPPLTKWLITGSYRLFGYNRIALRLPSVLAIFIATLLLFLWVQRFENWKIALTLVVVLTSVNGWYGHHVGLTGDADSILVLGLTMCGFFGHLYLETGRNYQAYMAAFGIAIGFYAKSFLGFLFVPGFVVYLLVDRYRLKRLASPPFYLALLIPLFAVLSWFTMIQLHGHTFLQDELPGDNAWDRMIQYDFLQRAGEEGVEGTDRNQPTGKATIVSMLDVRMSVWLYVAVAGMLLSLGKSSRRKEPMILLFLLQVAFMIGLFSFSSTLLNWYLAPIIGFVSFFAVIFIRWSSRVAPMISWIWILVIVGANVVHVYHFLPGMKEVTKEGDLASVLKNAPPGKKLWLVGEGSQRIRLMADWHSEAVQYVSGISGAMFHVRSGDLLLVSGRKSISTRADDRRLLRLLEQDNLTIYQVILPEFSPAEDQ